MAIASLIVLLLLSAAFSGTETAFFSLDEGRVSTLADGSRGGRRIAAMLRDPSRLLAALLIGNLTVNIVASVVATAALVEALGPNGVAVAVPVMTVALLLVGEITPKLLALRWPDRTAVLMRPAVDLWMTLTSPLLSGVVVSTGALLTRLPARRDRTGLDVDELVGASELAAAEAALTETEARFLTRLIQLGDRDVREIMTPRPAVVALAPDLERTEILAVARDSGFNRYPVLGPDDDRPRGLIHLKDLLGRDDARPLAGDLRPADFVPESKAVSSLLREMKAGGSHMACVVDEHGDYVGVVTHEDCLEALTGPWADESDHADPDVLQVADRNWVVAGLADLRLLNETVGTDIQPSPDAVTVGGFVMAALGRIPERGLRVQRDGFRFTVLEMDGRRVDRVRVQRLDDAGGEGET